MVLLNAGESVVKQGPVTRINPKGTRDGTLTLTNQRLLFEARVPEGPQGEPIIKTTINAPLRKVKNATVSGAGNARLEIELPEQRVLFQTPEAQPWLDAIVQARANAPPPVPGAGKGGGGGGAPAVVLRCRYCGTLNPPTVGKCTSCGAPI